MQKTQWYMRQVDRSWVRAFFVVVLPLMILGILATHWAKWSEPVTCNGNSRTLLRLEVSDAADGGGVTRTLSTDCDWHSNRTLVDTVRALANIPEIVTTTTKVAQRSTSTTKKAASTNVVIKATSTTVAGSNAGGKRTAPTTS